MADPVRVHVEWYGNSHVHPGDLARAVREGVDERLRKLLSYLQGDGTRKLTADDIAGAICLVVMPETPAPREPAQERQDKPEPPQHAEAMADMLRELEGWKDGPTSSDDTIRKHWLMRRAAATIRDLMARQDDEPTPAVHAAAAMLAAMPTPTPAGGADPLLPGLRAALHMMTAEGFDDKGIMVPKLRAEIARREGA